MIALIDITLNGYIKSNPKNKTIPNKRKMVAFL
jgi:hypothetical protein